MEAACGDSFAPVWDIPAMMLMMMIYTLAKLDVCLCLSLYMYVCMCLYVSVSVCLSVSVSSWEEPFDSALYCVKSDGGSDAFLVGTSRHSLIRLWDRRHRKPVQVLCLSVSGYMSLSGFISFFMFISICLAFSVAFSLCILLFRSFSLSSFHTYSCR